VLDKAKQALPYLCSYGIIRSNLTGVSIGVSDIGGEPARNTLQKEAS